MTTAEFARWLKIMDGEPEKKKKLDEASLYLVKLSTSIVKLIERYGKTHNINPDGLLKWYAGSMSIARTIGTERLKEEEEPWHFNPRSEWSDKS